MSKTLLNRRKIYSVGEKKNFLFIYLLIAIPVANFLIFWVYVNFRSILLAFQNDITGAFTFDHFKEVYEAAIGEREGFNIFDMLGKSLLIWSITNLVAWPISLLTTYVLFQKQPGHYIFRVIFLIPTIVGGVIWVGLIREMLGAQGPLIYLLRALKIPFDADGLEFGLLNSDANAFLTILFLSFLFTIPGGNIIATGAYARTPKDLIDAGKLDGLGFWGFFFHVYLPCSWSTLTTLMIINLCTIFVADGSVYLFTRGLGNHGTGNMGFYLYYLTVKISESTSLNKPYGYPAALGICITAISVPIVLFGRYVLNKILDAVEL